MTLSPSPCHHIPYHACPGPLLWSWNLSVILHMIFCWGWLVSSWVLPSGKGIRRTDQQDHHLNRTCSHWQTQRDPIPDFCVNFTDVFSERAYNILPPHWPFDHTIKLKDFFVPKITKVYPLNPTEKKLAKLSSMNIKRLDKLYPWSPHKLPHSSLSPKRMEIFILVKIIATLTVIPFKTDTLSPLFLSWLTTWRTPLFSPSLMSNGDITTSTFERRTNGKPHSSLHLVSSNPLPCFLVSAMLHQHFRHLWITSSLTWL